MGLVAGVAVDVEVPVIVDVMGKVEGDVTVSVAVRVVVVGCIMEGGSAKTPTARPAASLTATKDRPTVARAIAMMRRRRDMAIHAA